MQANQLIDCSLRDIEAERTSQILETFGENDYGPDLLVNAFHSRLLNRFGNYVSTEILVVKHEMSDKQQHFLVGLREFSDPTEDEERSYFTRGRTPSMYSTVTPGESASQQHETGSVASHGSLNTAIPTTCRQMFLDIDVVNGVVSGASAGLTDAINMSLKELFPVPHIDALLQRLEQQALATEANGEPLALALFSFQEMPMILPSGRGAVSGTMQVFKTSSGSIHVAW